MLVGSTGDSSVNGVAFSPGDASRVVSGDDQGNVILWGLSGGWVRTWEDVMGGRDGSTAGVFAQAGAEWVRVAGLGG